MHFRFGWTTMAAICCVGAGGAVAGQQVLRGEQAFGDWKRDKPGVVREITAKDLPKPGATPSVSNYSRVVPRPAGAMPQVSDGFKIDLFAEGLSGPRIMRVAPNGDIFVAETRAGRIQGVARGRRRAARPSANEVYASRPASAVRHRVLSRHGTNPNGSMSPTPIAWCAFPITAGDLKASGKAGNRRRRTAAWRRPFDPRHRLQPATASGC